MASNVTKVAVIGARGRMGRLSCEWIRACSDLQLVAEIEKEDSIVGTLQKSGATVALDFTIAHVARDVAFAIVDAGVRPVIGNSGLTPGDIEQLQKRIVQKQSGGIVVPNFSIGAVLMMRFAAEAARHMGACEVIEAHHTSKADAPSGTARATAARIAAGRLEIVDDLSREMVPGARGANVNDLRVHSVRLPGIVAHQEVWFGAEGETLRIVHDSTDRGSFRAGVLQAIRRVSALAGLHVGLEHVL